MTPVCPEVTNTLSLLYSGSHSALFFIIVLGMLKLFKLSKKINIISLSTAFIFSKLNMCKYLYEHNKIQQLRHKLNKFHRRD